MLKCSSQAENVYKFEGQQNNILFEITITCLVPNEKIDYEKDSEEEEEECMPPPPPLPRKTRHSLPIEQQESQQLFQDQSDNSEHSLIDQTQESGNAFEDIFALNPSPQKSLLGLFLQKY